LGQRDLRFALKAGREKDEYPDAEFPPKDVRQRTNPTRRGLAVRQRTDSLWRVTRVCKTNLSAYRSDDSEGLQNPDPEYSWSEWSKDRAPSEDLTHQKFLQTQIHRVICQMKVSHSFSNHQNKNYFLKKIIFVLILDSM
jgi:hypothetical protein